MKVRFSFVTFLSLMFQIYNMCFILRTIFYNDPLTLRDTGRLSKCSLSKTSRIVKELERKKLIKISVKGRSYLLYPNLENEFLKFELLKEEISYTTKILEKYPFLLERLKNVRGKIILIFGSHAACEATELSDIDILVINGKCEHGFNLSLNEFRKLLRDGNPTVLSIIKKHTIIGGFEDFIEEVLKWKKSLYGVLK